MSPEVLSHGISALPGRSHATIRGMLPDLAKHIDDSAGMTTGHLLESMVTTQSMSDCVKFWWDMVASTLCALLNRAKYPVSQQVQYLYFYRDVLIPALGPKPIEDRPHFHSFCNDDGSPVELSWNFSMGGSTVRICLEPIGEQAGRPADPFNQLAICALAVELAKIPGVSLAWFDYFRERFFVTKEDASKVHARMAPNEHTSVAAAAFDLKGGALLPKIYFFPTIKALQEATSEQILIKRALMNLDGLNSAMKDAFSKLEEFAAAFRHLRFECISFDCIEPALSRIKIYVRTPYTSLTKVKHIYAVGGRLRGADIDGTLRRLDILWSMLFPGITVNQDLPPCSHRTGGIIFNFELRPGCHLPVPKVYVPVRHYCPNDLMIAKSMAKFLAEEGHKDRGATYEADFQAVFPIPNPSKTIGTITYVGFSFNEQDGSYVTMYCNLRTFSSGCERDGGGKLMGPAIKTQPHWYD